MSVPGTLGLISGAGELPALVAGAARAAGWRVVAFALVEPGDLHGAADRVVPLRLGDVAPAIETLQAEAIRHVVLAGRVSKAGLFHGMRLDGAARELVGRASDWTDDGLLRVAASTLESMGIELFDQRRFLAPWLASPGLLAGPAVESAALDDARLGMEVARELARFAIGQTVVVKAGAVVAVEGLEGTDEAIARGLRLAGPGATVVKAPAPLHDFRFDVPTVGPETIARCAEGHARLLAVEAGRVLVLGRTAVAAEASRAGLSVIGLGGTAGG